ncbi:MAG: HAD family hydrolase [Gemmatimonadales bacterium]|nr:MAG: HAD family hydrolase [Gemmatimonadales bacterium]
MVPVLRPFDAILFDLLTGLLDSWSLWDWVAGDPEAGRRWRLRYLQLCYGAGEYRPWDSLVAKAATEASLPESKANELLSAWHRLEPWPEVPEILPNLGVQKIGVVTNCSDALALQAAQKVGIPLSVVVSAERAGAYKPDPRPYRLALSELKVQPQRTLFVAGSPSDIEGASAVGMRVYWHNRLGLAGGIHDRLEGESRDLRSLKDWVLSL